jgi:hypothetical protein
MEYDWLIGTAIGLLGGAGITLLFTWLERKRRREIAFRVLWTQFMAVPFTPGGLTPGEPIGRETFHLTAIDQLLDNGLVSSRADEANLIRALTHLKSAQERHNDAVLLLKTSSLSNDNDPKIYEHYLGELDGAHRYLREMILWVKALMPDLKEYEYDRMPEWPGDYEALDTAKPKLRKSVKLQQ